MLAAQGMGYGRSLLMFLTFLPSLTLSLNQHEFLLGSWGVLIGEMFDLEVCLVLNHYAL